MRTSTHRTAGRKEDKSQGRIGQDKKDRTGKTRSHCKKKIKEDINR